MVLTGLAVEDIHGEIRLPYAFFGIQLGTHLQETLLSLHLDEGSCGYATGSAGHVYADFCRDSDVDGYKNFPYCVYGN